MRLLKHRAGPRLEQNSDEVRALCPNSLKHLRDIGGLSSPVERIEIYRELLRL